MMGVLYIGGYTILSLTAGPPKIACSNEKMPSLSFYTSRRVIAQNVATVVASPFFLWQAKSWQK